MKIAAIRTTALSCKVDPPYASAAGAQSRRGGLLVEIETDSGITGIGEAGLGGGATATVIEKDLAPLLIGQDPLLIEGLWQKMFARTRQYGRNFKDCALLHDENTITWIKTGKQVPNTPANQRALLDECAGRGFTTGHSGNRFVAVPHWIGFIKLNL